MEIEARYSLTRSQVVAILVYGDQLSDQEVVDRLPKVKPGMTGREIQQVMNPLDMPGVQEENDGN